MIFFKNDIMLKFDPIHIESHFSRIMCYDIDLYSFDIPVRFTRAKNYWSFSSRNFLD